jgi:hypothetical protein
VGRLAKIKRRASGRGQRCVRPYQRQQLTPGHDLLHFVEQSLLARAPIAQIKAKVFLFHAAFVSVCILEHYWAGELLNMIPRDELLLSIHPELHSPQRYIQSAVHNKVGFPAVQYIAVPLQPWKF